MSDVVVVVMVCMDGIKNADLELGGGVPSGGRKLSESSQGTSALCTGAAQVRGGGALNSGDMGYLQRSGP